MWGSISGSSLTFLELHLGLVNNLAHLPWTRVEVWDNNVSVHEWQSGGRSPIAFDVIPRKGVTSVSLIARSTENFSKVRMILDAEGVPFSDIAGRPAASLLAEVPRGEVDLPPGHAREIAAIIKSTRATLDSAM